MSFFDQYPEFLPDKSGDLTNISYTRENALKRYSTWISNDEVKGLSFLDIGCQFAAVGAYVLHYGAAEYVGIDNKAKEALVAEENLRKYFKQKQWNIYRTSIEDFIGNNKKTFDVVFLGRILHGLSLNGNSILSDLSEICNCIIIESANPVNTAYDTIKAKYNVVDIEIEKYVEYEHSFVEYTDSSIGNFLNVLYSLGFLKEYFLRLGFEIDYAPYEKIKKIFPEEYGIGYINKKNNPLKKFIIRFNRRYDKGYISRLDYEFNNNILENL